MSVNTRELSLLLQEASTLSNKPNWTKQEEKRNAFLLSAISAVKAGASLQEIELEHHNEESRRNGLPTLSIASDGMTVEQRATAKFWQGAVHKEKRDVEGAPMLNHIGTYGTNGATFVPVEFFAKVFSQLKAHDPLFDEDACTVINATNGRVTTIPTVGDIEAVASVVAEAGSQTETDITVPGQAVLGTYAYKTPRWTISLEAFEDLQGSIDAISLFTDFASSRLRRGIGADLVVGNGSSKPLGLIPALENLASSATVHSAAASGALNAMRRTSISANSPASVASMRCPIPKNQSPLSRHSVRRDNASVGSSESSEPG